MFNISKLKEILVLYKGKFASEQWPNEKYKWEAVKCFRDNWNINAPDFADMLTRSLSKTRNLLASSNNFPAETLRSFSKAAPEEVRAMFIDLFDERNDVVSRILGFKAKAAELLEKYGNGAGQHYQYENAVSTYLWLHFPDKYYIYRYSDVKTVSETLGSEYLFKKGAYADNLRNFYALYDEIRAEIQKDTGLTDMLRSLTDSECYLDDSLCTLTMDVCFFTSRVLGAPKQPVKISGLPAENSEPAEEPTETETESNAEKYDKAAFLNEVYMTESKYGSLAAVLKNKKNIILQGAPGVGKTFAAKRLAYSVMGEKDDGRIEFVQFHQNYSYEDFMMGYKPVNDGFELKYGIFYRFCRKAESRPDKAFFFIIDEINRGNLSKIFGELLMLIERGYRGTKATLAYNGLDFSVPENLYIIGMMNTADRSLAMIDYALRRRFSFFEIEPGFDSEGFVKYRRSLGSETLDLLISKIQELNNEISLDRSLGKGFCIGHSYFCGQTECTDEWLRTVVDYDILPMLGEYWFDDPDRLRRWENILHGVFQ